MLDQASLEPLTGEELNALRGAGAWYASYHARQIAGEVGKGTAYAVEARERYLALVSALGKLGVGVALPDELARHDRQAA